MRTRRSARLRVAALVVGVVLFAVACNNGMTVDQKAVYTGAATTTITGTLSPAPDGHDHISSVTVNGVNATINGNTYSAVIPLDGAQIFNRVLVTSTWSDGEVITERRTVVYGDDTHSLVIPTNTMLGNNGGLRINAAALNALAGAIKQNVTIDTTSTAPVGTIVYDQGSYPDARATISQAPTISDWNISLAPQPGQVHATITLSNLKLQVYVDTDAFGALGRSPCGNLDISSDSMTVNADFGLQPKMGDPTHLDVNMLGTPQVDAGNVTSAWDGGVCGAFSGLVDLFLPNMASTISSALQGQLGNQSDGTKSPIATAMANALANVNVAGPIGSALGVNFTNNIRNVAIDNTGISLQTDSSFAANSVAPGAPNLPDMLAYFDSLGTLPATTPDGLPYGVAVGVSATCFNQLLASETERGLLNSTITDLNGQPLTMKTLLDAAMPGSGDSIPDSANFPVSIDFSPEVAPIVSPDAGGNGRPANLRMSGYRAVIKRSDTGDILMDLALDFELPMTLEPQNGLLQFVVDPPLAATLHVDTIKSFLNLSSDAMTALVQRLSGTLVQSVSQSLQGFPLPQFAGLTLTPVEFARVGTGLVLFANLS